MIIYKQHHDRGDLIPGIQDWFNTGKPMNATHDSNRLKKARKPHYHFPQMHKSMARSNRIVQNPRLCAMLRGSPEACEAASVVINLCSHPTPRHGPTLGAPRYSRRLASALAVHPEGPPTPLPVQLLSGRLQDFFFVLQQFGKHRIPFLLKLFILPVCFLKQF